MTKKITKNELLKAKKIAKNRIRFHCLPSVDDRPFLINKLFHEAIGQLLHEGYVEEKYFEIFPQQFNEKRIITEAMILEKMNELLLQ